MGLEQYKNYSEEKVPGPELVKESSEDHRDNVIEMPLRNAAETEETNESAEDDDIHLEKEKEHADAIEKTRGEIDALYDAEPAPAEDLEAEKKVHRFNERMEHYKKCPACGGSGKKYFIFLCKECGGLGSVVKSSESRSGYYDESGSHYD